MRWGNLIWAQILEIQCSFRTETCWMGEIYEIRVSRGTFLLSVWLSGLFCAVSSFSSEVTLCLSALSTAPSGWVESLFFIYLKNPPLILFFFFFKSLVFKHGVPSLEEKMMKMKFTLFFILFFIFLGCSLNTAPARGSEYVCYIRVCLKWCIL